MTIEEPAKPRHTIENSDHSLKIIIPFPWSRTRLLLYVAPIVFVLMQMILSARSSSFSPCLGLFLLAALILFGCMLFLGWKGKEIVEIDKSTLVIKRQPYQFRSPKRYSIEHVKELRTLDNPNGAWLGTGTLLFDYGVKTVNFGIGIDEPEARQILVAITQKFPNLGRKITN